MDNFPSEIKYRLKRKQWKIFGTLFGKERTNKCALWWAKQAPSRGATQGEKSSPLKTQYYVIPDYRWSFG